MQCEDEWGEMKERFKKEGLDFECVKGEERTLQVWRWLVDAETNLFNSRRMVEKLYKQQHEEIEEMENYIKTAVEKNDLMENERFDLYKEREKLENLLNVQRIDGRTLCDKVMWLLEERNKAEHYLEASKPVKISPSISVDAEADLLSELIKVSLEKESLKREVAELSERITLLEKTNRQLEIDNEGLSFKYSEVLAEIEEKETLLAFNKHPRGLHEGRDQPSDISRCSKDLSESKELSSKETLSNSFHKDPSQSMGADSTPPSLLMSDLASFGSPKKLSSLLQSCNELAWVEEIKKLQVECENLRAQLTKLGEKYNVLALKHIQYKTKRKFQIEEARERLEACECHISTLKGQLSIHRQRSRAEEILRKKIESDYMELQEEKNAMAARLLNAEALERELVILQRKVSLLETANSELVAQLMKLKYRRNLTKSTTCDDMLSTL